MNDETTPDPAALAELGLLGAVLYDPSILAIVGEIVRGEHFLDGVGRAIWEASVDLASEGARPDPVLVGQRLDGHRGFAEVGGITFLAELVDRAPPPENAVDYAKLVREQWQRRDLAEIAGQAAIAANTRGDVPIDEIVATLEARLLAIQASGRGVRLQSAEEVVEAVVAEMDGHVVVPSIDTGIAPLDEKIGGMQPGELWLMPARPSMGKSALASCIDLNVARHSRDAHGRPVGVIEVSLEIPTKAMMRRHITDWAYEIAPATAPSYAALRRHKKHPLKPEQVALIRHVAPQIAALRNLKLVYRTGLTVAMLRGLIRKQVAMWEREGIALGLVSIDHVGLMRASGRTNGRYEAQTEVAIELKELAGELGVPILALVQLSRDIEKRDDKHPMLSDMRDSGGWEENADGVIGIYRDAYYAQRETKPTKASDVDAWEARKSSRAIEALFLKIREGEAGTAELYGDMPRNAIRSSRPENAFGLGEEFLDPNRLPLGAYRPAGLQDQDDGRPTPPLEAYSAEEFA